MSGIACTNCNTTFEASKGYGTYCYDCANFSDQILMSDMFNAAADTLHAAEFGTPFHLHKDGTLREVVDFPEPYVQFVGTDSEGNDIFEGVEHGYAPVWGLTGQFGYSGPIMHESETVSAGMLRTIAERLGECVIYLAAVCDHSDAAYEDPDMEYGDAFGWAVLVRDVDDEEMYV